VKAFVEKDFKLTGISTGDVLREIVKSESGTFADNVRKQMQAGGWNNERATTEIFPYRLLLTLSTFIFYIHRQVSSPMM
jgi:adenylate kinase family enzyme